jgi:hypothetical protein
MPKPVAWAGVAAGLLLALADTLVPTIKLTPFPIILFVLGALLIGASIYIAVGQSTPAQAQGTQPLTQWQREAAQRALNDMYETMSSALADRRYSADTKLVISHQRDLLPLKEEWGELGHTRSLAEYKSPAAISFFNRRLRETRKDWQITPENVDATFGNVVLDSSMRGPFDTGIKIQGGGGNTFDQTDIRARTGIDLKETTGNSFSNTRINTPKPDEPGE